MNQQNNLLTEIENNLSTTAIQGVLVHFLFSVKIFGSMVPTQVDVHHYDSCGYIWTQTSTPNLSCGRSSLCHKRESHN